MRAPPSANRHFALTLFPNLLSEPINYNLLTTLMTVKLKWNVIKCKRSEKSAKQILEQETKHRIKQRPDTII
jgi:hypothetical protein